MLLVTAVLACILTWPLPRHFRTHLLGDPTGDLGNYVWNLWIFRHELLRHGHLPISSHVFAYSQFSLQTNTPIAGAVAAPSIGASGEVGMFERCNVNVHAADGYLCVFALARRLGLETWGGLVRWSPVHGLASVDREGDRTFQSGSLPPPFPYSCGHCLPTPMG